MGSLKQEGRKRPPSSRKSEEEKNSMKENKDPLDLSGLFDSSEAIAKGKALAKKYRQKGGE